jgi:GTP-binding protein Era
MSERADGLVEIHALVFVERDSQKGIIIGKQGNRLKQIGQAARREIERLLHAHVYLALWVKVRKDWSENEQLIRDMGYV